MGISKWALNLLQNNFMLTFMKKHHRNRGVTMGPY